MGQENGTTRERLIEAAGEVFARQGFSHATVREICSRAEANVAAVSYHFGDKLGLYSAVLRDAYRAAMEKYPPAAGLSPGASTRDRLHAFVRSFLYRILDRGRPAWHGKLMAREIAEPTAALDGLVEQSIRPNFELLCGIIRDHLGPGFDPLVVRRAAWSIVGQVLFYHFARPVIDRLARDVRFEPPEIDRVAEHVTRFSIGALAAMKRGRKAVAAP